MGVTVLQISGSEGTIGNLGKRKIIGTALLCLVVMAGAAVWGFRNLGYWLEMNDPLRHANAIVVLGGGVPFRAIEAANLFRGGWAPEVWVTQGAPDGADRAMAGIGFAVSHEHERSEEILRAMGVPATAIRVLPGLVDNTVSELRAIARFAGPESGARVILVTSKYHARRVRVVWNAVAHQLQVKTPPMLVRYPAEDPYDAERWWRTSTDAISTFRETFGIVNAFAGFPVAPKDR